MSSAAMVIFIKPSQTRHHGINNFLCKTQNPRPSFCTTKQSATVCRKSARLIKKTVAAVSTETRFVNGSHQKETLINYNGGLNVLVNRLSKWVVAVTFGGFIIMWRHDALALWAATGSVSNFILSITLKRIFKQQRPVSELSSGHGMPSSHAQTVFFTLVFIIISMIKWIGLNGGTMIVGILLVALGSYFSWLRVLLGYHTTSQVIAGTIVGSKFAVLWFWAWEAVVFHAYNSSNPWVQILLFVGAACYYVGFIFYVFLAFYNRFMFFIFYIFRDRLQSSNGRSVSIK